MKSVFFDGKNLLLKNIQEPFPTAEEVKIKLEWAGICSTDLQILEGCSNFTGVIGHEAVGKIVAAPAMPELIGKRAVFNINISCMKKSCKYCASFNFKHCPQRKALGIKDYPGVFSEFFIVPSKNVIEIPKTLDPRIAVFAEPLAAAIEPVSRNLIDKSEEVLVFGVGKLGSLVMLGLNALGFKTCGIVRSINRKQILEDTYPELNVKTNKEIAKTYQVIFDTTGNEKNLKTCLKYLQPQGKLIVKSTINEIDKQSKVGDIKLKQALTVKEINQIVRNEIMILGSRCGDMKQALELLTSGLVKPESLITAQYPLSKAGAAIIRAKKYSSSKVLIYNNTIHPSIN